MGRKNNRDARWVGEPIDVTPAEIERPVPTGRYATPREIENAHAHRRRDAAERQTAARVANAIDWSVCLVPGCGQELAQIGALRHRRVEWRDPSVALPMCFDHLYVAHRMVERSPDEPCLVDAAERLIERKAAKVVAVRDAAKKARLARQDGHMYFVRLNGLIKVGWTRDLHDRLRAYGPDVQILVTYEATRDDETNLHRQLKPALARGREWYEDGPILAAFIEQSLAEHGPPTISVNWSTPKPVVAGKRHR